MNAEDQDQKGQALVEHLAELRTRVINSIYGLVVGTVIAYNFTEQMFNYIRKPVQPYLPSGGLVFTHPIDKFVAHLKLAVAAGVILSCPFWLFQIWKFVAPGLYKREKKFAAYFIASGSALFVTGVSFAYFFVLPMAFKFLFHYGGDTDKPMITINEYFGFFTQMCMVFGVAFEVPVVLVLLHLIGVVSSELLKKYRRYAVMAQAVIAAIVTPPDLLSMLLMLFPMLALYEIAILVVGIMERKQSQVET